eukprot:SAG22_NODE_1387_length_4524_cov_2.915028_4_plen_409_part_00
MPCPHRPLPSARLFAVLSTCSLTQACFTCPHSPPPGGQDSGGKTARSYAEAKKARHIVEWIDNGGKVDKSDDEDDEEEEEEEAFNGESKTAKNKRLRREKERKEAGEAYGEKKEVAVEVVAEEVIETDADDAKPPVWEEVIKVHESCKGPGASILELNITRTENCDTVDPAVWRCLSLNRLQLRMPAGVLTALSPKVGRLKSLETLILTRNSISALPDSIGSLKKLKVLEIEDNKLATVPEPAVLGQLKHMQVLNVAGNQLTDAAVEKLGACMGSKLATLQLDRNLLTKLPIPWERLDHLSLFTATENKIDELPAGVGELTALANMNLSQNQIQHLPPEMGEVRACVPWCMGSLHGTTLARLAEMGCPAFENDVGPCCMRRGGMCVNVRCHCSFRRRNSRRSRWRATP